MNGGFINLELTDNLVLDETTATTEDVYKKVSSCYAYGKALLLKCIISTYEIIGVFPVCNINDDYYVVIPKFNSINNYQIVFDSSLNITASEITTA